MSPNIFDLAGTTAIRNAAKVAGAGIPNYVLWLSLVAMVCKPVAQFASKRAAVD